MTTLFSFAHMHTHGREQTNLQCCCATFHCSQHIHVMRDDTERNQSIRKPHSPGLILPMVEPAHHQQGALTHNVLSVGMDCKAIGAANINFKDPGWCFTVYSHQSKKNTTLLVWECSTAGPGTLPKLTQAEQSWFKIWHWKRWNLWKIWQKTKNNNSLSDHVQAVGGSKI